MQQSSSYINYPNCQYQTEITHAGVKQSPLWENQSLHSFRSCRGSDQCRVCPCQSCQLMWRSCSNPVHINPKYFRKGTHAGVSRWPLWENHSLHSFNLARDQIDEGCLLHNIEGWESLSLADTWDLVLGWALVADAAGLRLPGILSLPGITLPSIELLPCWKNGHWPLDPSSMSCRSCQLTRHSCSYPVHIHHQCCWKGTHVETFSPKLPFLQRVRSMHSVSFAMLKVDKFGRHRRPCVKKILWLLMPSSDGLQESTHYWESRCLFQFRARMSRGLNKFCHAERTIVQCLSGLASWRGSGPAIQFIYQLP